MDDIDAMFSDLLGEMDLLTQSLDQETVPPAPLPSTEKEANFSIGFTDLNASLHELEDNDLDALMADLVADLSATEEKLAAEIEGLKVPPPPPSEQQLPPPPKVLTTRPASSLTSPTSPASTSSNVSTPSPSTTSPLPPPQSKKPTKEEIEAQMKADKIKLALEKLKEAKVKKLVVKVLMNDGCSKTLMVDERQNVREVLDNMFEKTHCDCNVDWSLCETNPELQLVAEVTTWVEPRRSLGGVRAESRWGGGWRPPPSTPPPPHTTHHTFPRPTSSSSLHEFFESPRVFPSFWSFHQVRGRTSCHEEVLKSARMD